MLHRDISRAILAGLLALVAAATMALPAHADDDLPGRVGRVADVGGELFLAPQDAPDQWIAIGLNYPVTTGDNLWVGNEGRAEIDFGGGQFRLAGNTSLHLSRLDDRNFALYVAQGRVIVRVRVLDPGDTARIDTPNSQVALTRSGLYRIEVSEDRQHTQLAVREGEAVVDTGMNAQQVLPGQSATLDGAAPPYAELRNGVGSDGFDTWSANRDRHYDRGRANAPVSRQMVGYADLDQYGQWDTAPEYGAVWYPAGVGVDWAPYRNGYWTDVGGWGATWVDYAPWGYAPFHYGRWAYIRGRWGWCPGGYVARPVWAPALVGWIGGPGWRFSVGAPLYGWVPLGWGEAYHPSWRGCSNNCWARYNRPYAVNVAERPSAPPPRYANWNVPNAVTAVPGAAFVGRKPVQANLVAIPGNALTSAPVLRAPPTRPEIRQAAGFKPGNGMPLPASTTYATSARPSRIVTPAASAPATTIATPPAARVAPQYVAPAAPPSSAKPAQAVAPAVSTNTQPASRSVPVMVNPPGNAAVVDLPNARTENRPRNQPMPQPVLVSPSGSANGPGVQSAAPGKPVAVREQRVVVPATLAPVPAGGQPAAHPAIVAPAAPVTYVPPGPPPAAVHPAEAHKAEKPVPAAHAPAEATAK